MIEKLPTRVGLLMGSAAILTLSAFVVHAQPPATVPPAKLPVAPTPMPAGQPPKTIDLEKQVEDALREIDKLEKKGRPPEPRAAVPDPAKVVVPKVAPPPPPRSLGSSYTIGLQLRPPLPILTDHLQLPANQGLVVNEIQPDTVAAKSGLMKNDILMELNGKPVPNNVAAFNDHLKDYKVGANLAFSVIRHGKKTALKAFDTAQK